MVRRLCDPHVSPVRRDRGQKKEDRKKPNKRKKKSQHTHYIYILWAYIPYNVYARAFAYVATLRAWSCVREFRDELRICLRVVVRTGVVTGKVRSERATVNSPLGPAPGQMAYRWTAADDDRSPLSASASARCSVVVHRPRYRKVRRWGAKHR